MRSSPTRKVRVSISVIAIEKLHLNPTLACPVKMDGPGEVLGSAFCVELGFNLEVFSWPNISANLSWRLNAIQ